METVKLLLANVDQILLIIGAITGAVVSVCTIVNSFMPSVISNATLAKVEAITSMFSFGTKKATIVKKK